MGRRSRRIYGGFCAAILLLFSLLGISRIRFETDVLSALPQSLASVKAAESYHQFFDDTHQVTVLLTAPNGPLDQEVVADLARFLAESRPDCRLTYRNPFEEDSALFAREVARIWALSSPRDVLKFRDSLLDEEALMARLERLKDEILHSFDSGGAIARSYDPFGFLTHPALAELAQTEYLFESPDGHSRFFFIKQSASSTTPPQDWLESLRHFLQAWNARQEVPYQIGLTGSPVYHAEMNQEMNRDLYGTTALALGLIVALFLLFQRSIGHLLLLSGLTALTFFLTIGLAGWIIPELTIISLAFAAILLGLVIDYGIVILREGRQLSTRSVTQIRTTLLPSVFWAAVTSSLVFSSLLFSSFPGVQQLGILILIGLLVGAAVMLTAVPIAVSRLPLPASREPAMERLLSRHPLWENLGGKGRAEGLRKALLFLPLLLLILSGAVFAKKGLPSFEFSLSKLQPQPQHSEATQTHALLKEQFPAWSDRRVVLFASAPSAHALRAVLTRAKEQAQDYQKQGLISGLQLPHDLIPHQQAYTENLQVFRALLPRWGEIRSLALQAGFSPEGLKFNETIFESLLQLPDLYSSLDRPKETMMSASFYAHQEGQHYFRGSFDLNETLRPELLSQLSALQNDNLTMAGWQILDVILPPLVRSDFLRLYLPASLFLFTALLLVFRCLRRSVLIFLTLLSSIAVLTVIMQWRGYSWNLLSSLALPFMVGLGVDYSIHLTYSLQRSGQTLREVWEGAGKGIVLCGLSSSIGFYSLLFAQNPLLQSLGFAGGTGILLVLVVTLLIIPISTMAFGPKNPESSLHSS